jgi:hypothetical protein
VSSDEIPSVPPSEAGRYVDLRGVAELLGVKYETAKSYAHRFKNRGFPDPAVRVSGKPGWDPDDIRAWEASRVGQGRGPRPGRKLLANPLGRLERDFSPGDILSSFDLGRLLNTSAEHIVELRGHGLVPRGVVGLGRESGRPPALSFRYEQIHTWLTNNPLPELPTLWELRRRRRLAALTSR